VPVAGVASSDFHSGTYPVQSGDLDNLGCSRCRGTPSRAGGKYAPAGPTPPIDARRWDGADTDEKLDADHFSMLESDARATALIVEKWLAEQIPAGLSGPSQPRPHV
jgi:hypothetical protein